jgi:hypothetical protein
MISFAQRRLRHPCILLPEVLLFRRRLLLCLTVLFTGCREAPQTECTDEAISGIAVHLFDRSTGAVLRDTVYGCVFR